MGSAGFGVAALGVLWYVYVKRWSGSDERLRRMAASRWVFERHFSRRARRGEVTKEAWIEQAVPQLREMLRAGQLPLMVFWVGLGVYIAVQSAVR